MKELLNRLEERGRYDLPTTADLKKKGTELMHTGKTEVQKVKVVKFTPSEASVVVEPVGGGKSFVVYDLSRLRFPRADESIDEEVRPGQYFVLVDVGVAGGKMIGGLHHGAKSADKAAEKARKSGKNVQVLDAKWYGPAAELMKAKGMAEGYALEEATQKLLLASDLKKLPDLYSQENERDPMVYVKFFNPMGRGTWFATEFSPEQGLFFGYVMGLGGDELGYFHVKDLMRIRAERDSSFKPMRLSAAKAYQKKLHGQ